MPWARAKCVTSIDRRSAALVLEITLNLDQQRPARQQRPNRMAIEVLDAHLLKPAGLHNAGHARRWNDFEMTAARRRDLHVPVNPGRRADDALRLGEFVA